MKNQSYTNAKINITKTIRDKIYLLIIAYNNLPISNHNRL